MFGLHVHFGQVKFVRVPSALGVGLGGKVALRKSSDAPPFSVSFSPASLQFIAGWEGNTRMCLSTRIAIADRRRKRGRVAVTDARSRCAGGVSGLASG